MLQLQHDNPLNIVKNKIHRIKRPQTVDLPPESPIEPVFVKKRAKLGPFFPL